MTKAMEMIISGFASKGVNNLVDFGWKKIKDADLNRKSFEQNIETRIYQVIIDAINVFTFDAYKNQDILFYIAESILNGFKSEKENIEAVKKGLNMLELQITDDRCADFLGILCDEICKDKNDILYREINLIQAKQINEDVQKGFNKNEENQKSIRDDTQKGFKINEEYHQETHRKLDYLVEKADNKEDYYFSGVRVKNRAEEYAAKWNENVFLNDFNKRDKNAGKNIKLKDLYLEAQLPHYTWKTDNEQLSDLKELLKEYTVGNDGKNMLLILGQPGIGKSTLITWMMANFIEKKDDFLVYQFASDLKNIDWQGDDILSCIFQTLKMKYDELENKVLILDGFDEINANSDRERIVNQLNQELANMNILKNFSLIITCRENYVYELKKIECYFIVLQIWNAYQIKRFCEVYSKESGSYISKSKIDKLLESKEVFGIPLILYTVLVLDIVIEKSESLVDVYDQIFSIERSSIYDRCIKNSRYGEEHRISKNTIKQAIHQTSQRIAFWIFENNSEKAFIPQREYEDICNTVKKEISNGNEDIKRDFLIGNYFKLVNYCDGVGTQELHFIHRSIYEYFVAVYFFEYLHNLTNKEEVAGKLGELLKVGHLSKQILEFIKCKFGEMKGYNLCNIAREVFNTMLHDGMTYQMKERCKDVIIREMNIFANMLEVVHLWNLKLGELDNKRIIFYLQCSHRVDLNLRDLNLNGANLDRAYLSGAYLSEANLSEANLSRTYLKRADLSSTCLSEANLKEADLSEANLIGADLSGADLSGADLSWANLSWANLSRANLRKADLKEADLRKINLGESDLSGVDLSGANLIEVNLNKANLSGAALSGANLSETDLRKADLKEANLSGVDLIRADLSEAVLSGAVLIGTNLKGADITETIFDEKQINMLHNECDLTGSKVFISDTNEVIDYEEYCIRKKIE